ncbi:carbohydrate kinase [Phormidium sp. CLA17]|uniref:carbohydrate kinase family protein n=1 Tax=Leptolyngbya sp. Cla-17 TaxID=2803751 RepID=UPI0014910B61|nr:carbohydrate kinase [Leptolyngbya sp. Cla-17]MBM0741622.1 carbohydrate kinase [Leptolyngbya sp. Cla-17]
MTNPRVLCFGEILFDFLSDQPGSPYEQVASWTPYPGGAPANVACALVKLGTSSGFVGCVGEDDLGNILVRLLQETQVNIDGVQRHATAPTRGVYVVRSETGDRAFAGFGNIDTSEFADTQLQADQLPVELFKTAEFLVLGSLEMAYPNSYEATMQAIQLAKQFNTKILLDVNWRPVFWDDPAAAPAVIHQLVKQADFLKLSDEEAEWLFETTDPSAIANQVGDISGVLVTAGEKGCAYWLQGNQGKIHAFAIDVEDTTGAGDSFLAGFLHQLCQRGIQSLETADTAYAIVRYASAVGAMTTTRSGAIAAQPIAAEVEAFLQLNQ